MGKLFCFTKELLDKQRHLHTKQRIRLLFTSNKNTGKRWQKRPWFHCFILFLSPGKHVHQNKSFAVCAKAGSSSLGILLAFAIRFLQSIARPLSAPSTHSLTLSRWPKQRSQQMDSPLCKFHLLRVSSPVTSPQPRIHEYWNAFDRAWVSVKCFERIPLRGWIKLSGWKGHSIMENINSNVTRHANTITFSNVTLDRPW